MDTLGSGLDVVTALVRNKRGDDALNLSTKMLATSKQTHGSDHDITKKIRKKMDVLAEFAHLSKVYSAMLVEWVSMEEPVLVGEAEESSPTVGATNSVLESVTFGSTAKDIDIDEEDIEQKKYMGVARMHCKHLKEEKEKRLQEIADDGDSPLSTVELIATLGLSARQGLDEARGARRMAAMRRRRVKGGGGGNSKPELAGEEKMTMMTTTNEFITAVSMEEPVLVVEAVELILPMKSLSFGARRK